MLTGSLGTMEWSALTWHTEYVSSRYWG